MLHFSLKRVLQIRIPRVSMFLFPYALLSTSKFNAEVPIQHSHSLLSVIEAKASQAEARSIDHRFWVSGRIRGFRDVSFGV